MILNKKPKLILPKDEKEEKLKIPKGPKETQEYLDTIPDPVGYRILVRPWTGKAKTKGGIYLTDKTLETKEITTVVGLVVKMGALCYKDKEKFSEGPWCKEGQFVIYGRYAGARFKTNYGEHRILNDDEIIGTIKKPEDIHALF